jgi:ubiquinone/menaquinone biosynthesis C-methylase UbiE
MPSVDTKQPAIEQHSRQADEFAARYRRPEEDAYRSCFLYSRKRLDAALWKRFPANGAGLKVLDVGCGTGHQLAKLRESGFTVAGIDASPEMLVHARKLNPDADVRLADVESIPFESGQFDYVLCVEVLRYLRDPEPCLREMARVLRPGGCCFVTALPLFNLNGYWLVNRLAGLLPTKRLVRLQQYFATSLGLRASLQRSGFRQIEVHGVYIGAMNWIERLTPRFLPFFLKHWERCDSSLADRWLLRDFSNMYLACAKK